MSAGGRDETFCLASKIWARFSIYLRREVAKRAGLSQRAFRDHARVSFAKVADYQRRGAIHFHAVVRPDGPGGGDTSPPAWATADLLADAIRAASAAADVPGPVIDGRAHTFALGTQLDIRPIRSADLDGGTELTDRAVAAYIAKYATKGAETATGTLDPVSKAFRVAAVKLSEWLPYWLDNIIKPRRKRTTAAKYEVHVRLYLVPMIGSKRLESLSVADVRRFLVQVAKNTSAATAKESHRVLRTALTAACREEPGSRNVATLVEPPNVTARELSPWSLDETLGFLAAARKDPLYAACVLAIALGFRHGTAALLTAAGVAPRVVMEVLGHSQIAVTMNVYTPSSRTPNATPSATWTGCSGGVPGRE